MLAVAALLCCAAAASAQNLGEEETAFYRQNGFIPLQGEQVGDYLAGRYLVIEDVYIRKNTTMTFAPGSIIHFKKDKKITIEGRLICAGNAGKRVLFTALPPNQYYIPLDQQLDARWDGLFVEDGGAVELRFTAVEKSKFGIVIADDFEHALLDSVMLRDNRYHNMKLGKEPVMIPDGEIISQELRPAAAQSPSSDTVPAQAPVRGPWWRTSTIRIGIAGIAAASVAATGYLEYRAAHYDRKYNDYPTATDNYRAEVERAEKNAAKRDRAILGRNAASALAAAAGIGLAFTFYF
jgi:hypothetical protein